MPLFLPNRISRPACMLILAVMLLAAPARAEQYAATPEDAPWADLYAQRYAAMDPKRDPLEIEIVKAWDEEGIHYEAMYFTGQIAEGVPTRVYAIRGVPAAGENLPGILYAHGGGQTAYFEWVQFWARKGYACLSFDYSGDTNKYGPQYKREHFTKWGSGVENQLAEWLSTPAMDRQPTGDGWYQNVWAARRALTVLEQTERVDPTKLGLYGVSAGAYMSWLLAAVDERVKTVVPIFGGGGVWRDPNAVPLPFGTDEDERTRFLQAPGSPDYHAPFIKASMLYMSGTNDGAFNMDPMMDVFDRLRTPEAYLVLQPRANHHMDPPWAHSLGLWMDVQLKGQGGPWPKIPRLEVVGAGMVPELRLHPERGDEIERVEMLYALNGNWGPLRYWRDAENLRREGDVFFAQAPVMGTTDTLVAVANVFYKSGVTASARPVYVNVAELSGPRITLRHAKAIDAMEVVGPWVWGPAYPDPKRDDVYLKLWTDSAGMTGITINPFKCENPPFVSDDGTTLTFHFGTLKPNDPGYCGIGETGIAIDVSRERGPAEIVLFVNTLVGHHGTKTWEYSAPAIASGTGWQTVSAKAGDFKSAEGEALDGFDGVIYFGLKGKSGTEAPPAFRNLRWE